MLFCRSEPARDGGLAADQSPSECTQSHCRSEPARDSVLTADQSLADVLNPCGSCGATIRLASDDGLPSPQNRQPIPPSPSISLALAGWSAIKNEWSGLLLRAVVVCGDRSGSSIYRGSSYESSWETRVSPVVAGFFCRAAQRLRQSSATASCCASTTSGAYLSDPGRHPGGGRYVCGRTSHSAYHHHSLCHAVA